jgi:predicted glycosyltransferase
VRDVCRQTSHERVAPDAWARRVADALDARFDALLVHADPSFTVLGEHLPTAGELGIPVEHTGFVSEKGRGASPGAGGPGVVVASSGGGARGAPFASRVVAAWARLAARGRTRGRRLVVFAGAFAEPAAVERLRAEASAVGASVRPFDAGFLDALAGCELSISRAGYNTCTNLLETRVRALLVPDPAMSDQAFRAARLAQHGVAAVLDDDGADPDAFADSIEAALQRDPPAHAFDLGGALRTSRVLAAL